jgi:outer membrane biosynthesis protein TonB
MDSGEKNRKRKAIIVTVIFHAVALILFIFFGLTQPVPLPEEQGASIEFGWDADAAGASVADVQSTPDQQVSESQPEEVVESTDSETPVDEVAVDDESTVAVPPKKEKVEKPNKPKEDPKPKEPTKPVEAPKPTITDKLSEALGSLSKPSGGGSQGETTGTGDQGNPQGTTGMGALGGGSGSWQLDGRSMMPGFGTKIRDTKEEGIVVLNISVDQNGKVTQASANLRESTTTSQYLINLAITDAKNNFRFNSDAGAAIEQRGKVRYVFQLK